MYLAKFQQQQQQSSSKFFYSALLTFKSHINFFFLFIYRLDLIAQMIKIQLVKY